MFDSYRIGVMMGLRYGPIMGKYHGAREADFVNGIILP